MGSKREWRTPAFGRHRRAGRPPAADETRADLPPLPFDAGVLGPAEPLGHRTSEAGDRRAILRAQRLVGNRAVARLLARSAPAVLRLGEHRVDGEGGAPIIPLVQRWVAAQPTPTLPAPIPQQVIPHSLTPIAAPGERITYNSHYAHDEPQRFRLRFTAAGGAFDAPNGSATKIVNGLASGNVDFFVRPVWNQGDTVRVRLQVVQIEGNRVHHQTIWTFSKKTYVPETIQQMEGDDEYPLPHTYTYRLGPARGAVGAYRALTIRERFGPRACNIEVADLKEDYRQSLTSHDAIVAYFFGYPIQNGTFTVSDQDQIHDIHSYIPDWKTFDRALNARKEIHFDELQYFEATAGQALGCYRVRRILKPDGTQAVRKFRVVG